jgi:Domain of unknown function (DUF4326)
MDFGGRKMKTKVVHCRKSKYDIYIGRPSKWGNPFKLAAGADRKVVLRKYRAWLMKQEDLLSHLREIRGKVLGCWCKPEHCHGDVLAELADKLVVASENESPAKRRRKAG